MHSRSSTTPLAEIETRRRVALFVGPRWRLSRMFTPLRPRLPRPTPGCGGGRPATVSPQAHFELARAAIPPLPRACPVPHPKKVRRCRASHRCRVVARKAIRSGPGGPGLAGLAVGPVIARPRRGRAARLGLPGRTLRGPSPSAAARPFASASAPGGGEVRACPPLRRGAAPCTTAAPRPPPCAGPGSCPGPCRDRRLRRPLRRAGFNF